MPGDNDNRHQPDTPRNPRPITHWPSDEDNPFVAFRRYADEQLSSMLHTVMGLSSMITPSVFSSDRWDVFRPHPGSSGSRTNNSNNDENDIEAHRYYANASTFPGSFWRDDFDDFFPFSARSGLPFMSPFEAGWLDDGLAWPGAFLVLSPYSPLNLERREALQRRLAQRGDAGGNGGGVFSGFMEALRPGDANSGQQGAGAVYNESSEPRWYEAFEDLMRVENGMPMLDRDPNAAAEKRETGMEWIRGMVQRGSLGEGWKWQGGDGTNPEGFFFLERGGNGPQRTALQWAASDGQGAADKEKGESAITEQELYERFLDDLESDLQRGKREFSKFFDESRTLRFLLGGDDNRDGSNPGSPHQRQVDSKDRSETWFDMPFDNNDKAVQQPSPAKYETQSEPISTSTNTQRNRMADGSIHTKTVKTQRFADGREESNQTIDVANAPEQRRIPDQEGSAGEQDSSSKSGGWFWSR